MSCQERISTGRCYGQLDMQQSETSENGCTDAIRRNKVPLEQLYCISGMVGRERAKIAPLKSPSHSTSMCAREGLHSELACKLLLVLAYLSGSMRYTSYTTNSTIERY